MRSAINYSLSNLKSSKGDAMSKTLLDNFNSIDIKDPSVQLDAASMMSRQDKQLAVKGIYQKKKDLGGGQKWF
jgi:hypothetical protein